MAQSPELQPGFEDVFNTLSQIPAEELLDLKHKVKRLLPGPSSVLLEAMVLLALGQETDARVCLDALGDNQAAQYVQQIKLGVVGVPEDQEDLQPGRLDARALLAQVYSILVKEKLCSRKAMDKAVGASRACGASQEAGGDTAQNVAAAGQENHGSAASVASGDRFHTLRSDADEGFLRTTNPNYAARSSPVQIGGNLHLPGPGTSPSMGSSSFPSHFEISASPTVAFHTPPSSHERVLQLCQGSTNGQPEGDRQSHSPQETSWASRSGSAGQDTDAQVSQPQVHSQNPALPVPEEQVPTAGVMNQPVENRDISSTATAEPPQPKENPDAKEDEKPQPTDLPDSRATADAAAARVSMEDPWVPAGCPANTAPAATSTSSLPLPPPYYFSSTLPSQEAPSSSSHPPPLSSRCFPSWPPPLEPAEPVPTAEPDGATFFTFVVLHTSEDEAVAHRVKHQLEKMGVPNGATMCENFSIAGRSHLTCFQDAMENSAFILLLLTKNFPCHLCTFQANTALMESILNPAKRDSVIPFVPKENPLERSQIPTLLGGLMPLDENSPGFSRTVQNTFSSSRISERKVLWDQKQRRKRERYQTQQQLAALNLGSHPQVPPSA
ncbi:TCAM1 protein, partial [Rhinopomastus cyanomelas]|nr:TCAM1 protein [Rhinopomastus cyanomelas]